MVPEPSMSASTNVACGLIVIDGEIFHPGPRSRQGTAPVPSVAIPPRPFAPVKFSGLIERVSACARRHRFPSPTPIPFHAPSLATTDGLVPIRTDAHHHSERRRAAGLKPGPSGRRRSGRCRTRTRNTRRHRRCIQERATPESRGRGIPDRRVGGALSGRQPRHCLLRSSVIERAQGAAMGAGSHHARSARSPRTRPGSKGQPPSPTAGWAHRYRVDAPWAGSPSTLRAPDARGSAVMGVRSCHDAFGPQRRRRRRRRR
jgi:hypothetical protein